MKALRVIISGYLSFSKRKQGVCYGFVFERELQLNCSQRMKSAYVETCIDVGTIWHRRKLPFEILNFATKIGKFCHKKLPILPHFAIKIAKFCKLSFLFNVYFGPGGPEY